MKGIKRPESVPIDYKRQKEATYIGIGVVKTDFTICILEVFIDIQVV